MPALHAADRYLRRAVNPISTKVTLLVQTRRLGLRSSHRELFGWRPTRRHAMPRPVTGQPVPHVVGLSPDEAITAVNRAGLVAVTPGIDGTLLIDPIGAYGVVVDQHPAAGVRCPPESHVTLWFDQGPGPAGVREPRRPGPIIHAAPGMRDEATGEPIG